VPVAKMNRFLNRAAKWVQRDLILNSLLNAVDGSVTITTDGINTSFSMVVVDPLFILFAEERDTAGNRIARAEQIKAEDAYEYPVWDDNRNCWRFWMTRNATTGNWLMNFFEPPGSGTIFVLSYAIEQVALDLAMADDALRFTKIPLPYDELIVARATLGLLGPDPSLAALAATNYAEMRRQMFNLTSARSGYNEVIRDG
jgi:hypothetical protein